MKLRKCGASELGTIDDCLCLQEMAAAAATRPAWLNEATRSRLAASASIDWRLSVPPSSTTTPSSSSSSHDNKMAPTATGAANAAGASSSTAAPSADAAATTTSSSSLPESLEEAQQRYTSLKSHLDTCLAKKRTIDRSLADLESQIWLFEGSYFQSTAASGGNIIKGFDNYLKTTAGLAGGAGSSRGGAAAQAQAMAAAAAAQNNPAAQLVMENGEVPPEDRVFSASSLTYQRSLELKAAEELAKQRAAATASAAAASGSGSKGGAETAGKKSKKKDKAGGEEGEGVGTPVAGKEKKDKKRRREE